MIKLILTVLILLWFDLSWADTLVIIPEVQINQVAVLDPVSNVTGTTEVAINLDTFKETRKALKARDKNENTIEYGTAPRYVKDGLVYLIFRFYDGQITVDDKTFPIKAKVVQTDNVDIWLEKNGFKPEAGK